MALLAVMVGCARHDPTAAVERGGIRPVVIERDPPRRVIVESRRPVRKPVIIEPRVVGPPVAIEPRPVGPPVIFEHRPPPPVAERRPRSRLHPDEQPLVIEHQAPPARRDPQRDRLIKNRAKRPTEK